MTVQLSTVLGEVRRLTRTNTNTLPDSAVIPLTNMAFLEIQRRFALDAISVFGVIAQLNVAAGQDNYKFPTDSFGIERIEINYEVGLPSTGWKKITEVDLSNLPYEWFSWIKQQTQQNPQMDLFGGRLFVEPTPTTDVTNGLRAWYIKKQDDFVSSGSVVPSPLDLHWEMLAYLTAQKYFLPISVNDAENMKNQYEQKVQEVTLLLKSENDEPIKTKITDYTNYGNI